ncbi:MAG: acetate/propionate family kinase, partial [Calditrichaeota bacterium]
MKIAVCNIGSSSLKFQLLDMQDESVLAIGGIERVGHENAVIKFVAGENELNGVKHIPSHREAVQTMLDFLIDPANSLLQSYADIDAVGFKTVQAGEQNGSVLLTDWVLEAMEYYAPLAPAHNPPYLSAIRMFFECLPGIPLVGVFEPGFHAHAPEYAKIYGTPYDWIEKFGVKKYGYHGASHRFVCEKTVALLNSPKNYKIISCHLGGSSSLCAYKDGVAIDTSMGFTPQSGLIQGTRTGDLDAFVLPYIMDKKGISLEQALDECTKNAGLAGLSGTSGDMRDINAAIARGSTRARLAKDKFIYDIKRYVGEFLIIMQGLDALAFAGGIGLKDPELRDEVCNALSFLGCSIDPGKNSKNAEM